MFLFNRRPTGWQRVGLILLTVGLAGCFGRLPDELGGQKIDSKAYGLDGTRPALLVFSAVWCKPCMSEIGSLNRANRELGDKVQIVALLVEGPQKGVPSSAKDSSLVESPTGERPAYKVSLDPEWALFDSLKPDAGRALPTMVFVAQDQTIQRIVQRSMEYDSELLPTLKALASGQAPVTPKPKEPEPVGTPFNLSLSEWASAPEHAPSTVIYQNLQAAWSHGLTDFNFLADDMPFEEAKLALIKLSDGSSRLTSAVWKASQTGCKLTVYVHADGSYDYSVGVCR